MLRVLYALLIGLFGAGIIHIAILFLVPDFSERDAWSRLAMASDFYKITRLDTEVDGGPIVRAGDPLFRAVACRFDLEDGPVQVNAPGLVPFWSMSVYNRSGQNIYSFNDRAAQSGLLDVVVLTPEQMIDLRKDVPAELQRSVFVETQIGEGIVVVRGFAPDESWTKAIGEFLGGAACTLR